MGRSISDWSVEQFGDELAEAFEEFHPESRRIGERDFALLLNWFNSDRELSGGGAPVAHYLARPDLDPDERDVAERIAAAWLGLSRARCRPRSLATASPPTASGSTTQDTRYGRRVHGFSFPGNDSS